MADAAMRVVLFGDSVMAGYGLSERARPAVRLVEAFGPRADIVDASAPDRTAEDGLALVGEIMGEIVLVEFGLNDAIQGVAPRRTHAALAEIVAALKAKGSRVTLVEALTPARSTYPAQIEHAGLMKAIAERSGAGFVSNVLTGFELRDDQVQNDGLHPNEAGAELLADRLAAAIQDALAALDR